MISFADTTTEDIYHGRDTKAARRIPKMLWSRIQLKLDLLNAASRLEDIAVVPSNRLEKLRGTLAGLHSIRVNDQYRIVFQFNTGNCLQVRCIDYR